MTVSPAQNRCQYPARCLPIGIPIPRAHGSQSQIRENFCTLSPSGVSGRIRPLHFSNLAVIEMLARNSLETRQLVLARTVASMNSPCVILGSRAMTLR